MTIRPTLFWIIFRVPFMAAIGFSLALALGVLLPRNTLAWNDANPLFLILLLSLACGLSTTGTAHRFLFTRRFSPDTLFTHALLASLIALLVALTPAALIIWTGLGASYQEHLNANPLFPLMTPVEMTIPFAWFAAAFFLIPAIFYARFRAAQPTKGRAAGPLLFIAWCIVLNILFFAFSHVDGLRFWIALLTTTLVSLCFLIVSRSLHRSLEYAA